MATSQCPRSKERATRPRTIRPCDPYSEYRTLITSIAEALTADDIYKLAYQNNITVTVVPGSTVGQAISLFRILEKKNKLGPSKISSLSDMLVRINRQDLNNDLVKAFQKRIGQVHSAVQEWAIDSDTQEPELYYEHRRRQHHTLPGNPESHACKNTSRQQSTPEAYSEYFSKSQLSLVSLESNSTSHSSLVVTGSHSFYRPSGYNSQASDLSSTTSDFHRLDTSSCSSQHYHQYDDEHCLLAESIESASQGEPTIVNSDQYIQLNDSLTSRSEKQPLADSNPQLMLLSRPRRSPNLNSIANPPDPLSRAKTRRLVLPLRTSEEYDDVSTLRMSNSLFTKVVHQSASLRSQSEEEAKSAYGSLTNVSEFSDKEVTLNSSEDSESPTTSLKATRTKIKLSHSVRTRLKQVIRPKSAKRVIWHVKRNKLNKVIYEHKENKLLQCPDKIEVDIPRSGSAHKLKLSIGLYPYGLERDRGRHATLRVDIDIPKKAPKLHDSAKVQVVITVIDPSIDRELKLCTKIISTFTRESYIYSIVSHNHLKESKSETIRIKCNAKILELFSGYDV